MLVCSVTLRGVITALPSRIHASLHGCAGNYCPEQNQTINPNCTLIVNHTLLYLTIVVMTEME